MNDKTSAGAPVLTELSQSATAATEAARRVVERYAQPSLLNHAHRSYLWARSYADRFAVVHDEELLYVAALLHDLGLEAPFDAHRLPFEEAGGQVGWVFAAAAGWPPDRCQRVADVIIRHMGDDVAADDDPESFLLIRSTTFDISGGGAEDWPEAVRGPVLDAYPRLGLAADFAGCFDDQARRKPGSAAAAAVRSGIALRLQRNPLER